VRLIAAVLVMVVAGCGIFIRYKVLAPAKVAASNLEAINGLTVGQTTEAELLGRSTFQKIEEECSQGDCIYHMEAENNLLNKLHLAPRTRMATAVFVREGMVTGVLVYTKKAGFPAISFRQVSEMPSGCSSDPCVKRLAPPNRALAGISIVFSNSSEMRNHMPDAVNADCFSRLHGCATPAEFLPVTRNLDLGTITSRVK
jgi:hypothetical protein